MTSGMERRFLSQSVVAALISILIPMTMTTAQSDLKTPVAKLVPKTDTVHGDIRVDNYFWLREKTNPEVIAHLEAENKYMEAMTAHTKPLQEKLYQEMIGRIVETDLDVPARRDDYFYYTRTEEGKQYKIHCRKKGTLDASEEVLLDINKEAAGFEHFDVGVFAVSPDHSLLAYTVDTTGAEEYTIYVRDLATGKNLADAIPNTYNIEWAADNKTIFYTTLDAAHRPYRLYKHKLASDPASDALVYEEKDEAFYMGIGATKSKEYLFMALGSISSSEYRYLKSDTPDAEWKVIAPRRKDVEYSVDHHGDRFYVVTNDGARNFKVVFAPVTEPAQANWNEFLPHRDAVKVDAVECFANHMVVYERENGLKKMRIIDLKSGNFHYVDFPEPVYTFSGEANPEFNTELVRFTYNSLVSPKSVFDYNMTTKARELKKEYEVKGGYDRTQYETERVFATAKDGVKVPISLVYKKGIKRDGSQPLLLYAYGSYGYAMEPTFSSNRLSLLDRGMVYAIAHVRGGDEMGRQWYDDGKLLKKKNTFTDYIACAEHLIAEKYTSADRMAAMGGSAGGLLMGAIVNMRPDLFKVVFASVPFVDVINTMLDETIPLTVIEFDEWGNPKNKEFYDYMLSYSPYDQLEAKDYPHMLVDAGLNDPRVGYWEPAKWVAKLRSMKTDKNDLVFKIEMGAGHMGASGRYDYLKDIAFEYAFILDHLGIKN